MNKGLSSKLSFYSCMRLTRLPILFYKQMTREYKGYPIHYKESKLTTLLANQRVSIPIRKSSTRVSTTFAKESSPRNKFNIVDTKIKICYILFE